MIKAAQMLRAACLFGAEIPRRSVRHIAVRPRICFLYYRGLLNHTSHRKNS
jgi:hypothetical protein